MKEPQEVHINPRNSLVVVVDMENEHCKPGGRNYSPYKAQRMPGVISVIGSFLERARDVSIPVIYVQSVRTLKEPEFTVFGRAPYLEKGTWAVEIVSELEPDKKDPVVQKFTHDPFYNTDLDRLLPGLVPDPTSCYAIITGGGLATCVRHAVMGFYLRGYWTVVPEDCVYAGNDAEREGALAHFSQRGYPSIFLSRSDLIKISADPAVTGPRPVPGK